MKNIDTLIRAIENSYKKNTELISQITKKVGQEIVELLQGLANSIDTQHTSMSYQN